MESVKLLKLLTMIFLLLTLSILQFGKNLENLVFLITVYFLSSILSFGELYFLFWIQDFFRLFQTL